MTYLLDVGVVLALLDRTHVAHGTAHNWFAGSGRQSWATCPIVENGVVRILSQPVYPNSMASPAVAATYLQRFCKAGGHEFWGDELSLISSSLVDTTHLLSPAQITDTYLLALAVAHGGSLATLDRRIATNAVPSGRSHLYVLNSH